MRTFITGASGSVGLAVTEHLLSLGEHVLAFDAQPAPARALARFKELPGRFEHVQGSVCSPEDLRLAMNRYEPHQLITLAAITAGVDRERAAPSSIFEVNVGGVVAAIETAARAGVGRVLHLSSGSAYGRSGESEGILQEDATPLKPEGLYGISKRASEEVALRLGALYGIDVTVGRLGTCYGPWEHATGVRDTPSALLQIIQLAQAGEQAVLPRDSTRDWLYVRDAACVIGALVNARNLPHALYNIAADFQFSASQWCDRLARFFPRFAWRFAGGGYAPNVDFYGPYDRAPMDIARLLADTGFVPLFNLDAASADFVQWLTAQSADPESSDPS